jgi:hypothetical protein
MPADHPCPVCLSEKRFAVLEQRIETLDVGQAMHEARLNGHDVTMAQVIELLVALQASSRRQEAAFESQGKVLSDLAENDRRGMVILQRLLEADEDRRAYLPKEK